MSLIQRITAKFRKNGAGIKLGAPLLNQRFNHDLLMNAGSPQGKSDLEKATQQYPQIIHVLDHPELREKFAEYETQANQARDSVRLLGFMAILSIAISLIVIATKPMFPAVAWVRWAALGIEIAGVIASMISVGGIWSGDSKRRWLESRLMTERLRQWHFQFMLLCGEEIEDSCRSSIAVRDFETTRARALNVFLNAYEGSLEGKVEDFATNPTHIGTWLHEHPSAYSINSVVLSNIMDAYHWLRFDHQKQYATFKLRKLNDKQFWEFLKWPAVLQLAALSGISSFCFICALSCSAVLVFGDVLGFPPKLELAVNTGAICIAIVGTALRAIQEGLSLEKEIERYSDYRGRTSELSERFENAKDDRERLHLMRELELATVDEMKSFLRTHYNARFIL